MLHAHVLLCAAHVLLCCGVSYLGDLGLALLERELLQQRDARLRAERFVEVMKHAHLLAETDNTTVSDVIQHAHLLAETDNTTVSDAMHDMQYAHLLADTDTKQSGYTVYQTVLFNNFMAGC